MARQNPTWYETPAVQEMLSSLGGKAVRGVMSNYNSAKLLTGKVGLIGLIEYFDATLDPEDRRAIIICDEYTQRFTKKITDLLETIDMEYRIWPKVIPEIPLPQIDEVVQLCNEFKPKVIIAIGGGSVMDAGKITMLKYEKPEENLLLIIPIGSVGLRKKIKYFVAIPTTSGTGSEVTSAAVFTDTSRDPPKKIEVMCDEFVPDIAVLDTDFVKDMPPFLTMATGLDALSHSVGSYVSNWGTPYVDAMNITAIKEIIKYLPRAYKHGSDLEARAHMQMAATMAGLGFGNSIPGIDHSLGHSFGKVFGVHHGLSVGLFTPYSVDFQSKITDRWVDLCPIFGVEVKGKEKDELFKEFMQSLKNFIQSVDGPTCVKELKNPVINKEEYFDKLDLVADYAFNDAVSLFSYRTITPEIMRKIFEYAWDGKPIDF
ncbi:MAG: iron-containing alcohol dehydrogenase [Promethearchaeota archaeon]